MAEQARDQRAAGLAMADPGGDLAAFAAPPAGQAAIRGRPGDAAFMAAAESALGLPLPTTPGRAAEAPDCAIFPLGPDHWLAAHDSDAGFGLRLEQTPGLRAMDMSSARTRVFLRGPAARDLLAVGATVDFRPEAFPQGAVAQTPLGNATAIIHAREANAFDIYIARSFARSWSKWLAHAGREFGLKLSEESP